MSGDETVGLNAAKKLQMIRINRQINRAIRFASDMEQYGKEEYWEYPISGFGDCEDMALEKRRRLVSTSAVPHRMAEALRILSSYC